MKIKDSTIISLLMFTWFLIACGVLGAESEIARIENQINELYSAQNASCEALDELRDENIRQDERMAEIERYDRIQDIRLDAHRESLNNLDDLYVDMMEQMTGMEEKIDAMPRNVLNLNLSEADIRNIASLVYLEAGSNSCSDELQRAIASVIFNRMIRYNMTASQVIYQQGVFSPASRVSRTIPSERALRNVQHVISNGCTLPSSVVAFRMGHYHSFGHRYCKIDNVYFTAI